MHITERLRNLVRGMLGGWITRRERRNPEAVYDSAIQERLASYVRLREAAAGILYMRSKLAKELDANTTELERARSQLAIAVERDDDAAALVLIQRRDALTAEVSRLSGDLTELTGEADTAKANLVTFQTDIARLKEEKTWMLARLANAKARLRFQATLNGLAPDADIRALDEVRDHINRLVAETQLTREIADTDLDRRLGAIREAESDASARAQLAEMKRARMLVPVAWPPDKVAVERRSAAS